MHKRIFRLAAACIWAVLAFVFPASIAGDTNTDWFDLSSASEQHWELAPDPANAAALRLKPKEPLESGEPRSIMVLFPKASSAYDIALNTILGVFSAHRIPAAFTLINFQNDLDGGLEALEDAEQMNCDLLFSMGSRSTQLIYDHYSGGSLPVVSVCSKDPVLLGQIADYGAGSGNNIAFTSLDAPTNLQLTYLLRLKKNLQNIAIMYARDNISAVQTQVKPMVSLAQKEGIRVIDVVVEDQDKAREELVRKVPQAVEKIRTTDPDQRDSIFWITGSTSVFQEIETIDRLAGNIPVLSVVPEIVREDDASAVLSVGVSFENNALKAALYALEILENNVKPGDLEVGLVSPPDIAINFKKAREIDLTIPFSFFESASTVYDYDGEVVRYKGERILKP